jgi:hypothetical protein
MRANVLLHDDPRKTVNSGSVDIPDVMHRTIHVSQRRGLARRCYLGISQGPVPQDTRRARMGHADLIEELATLGRPPVGSAALARRARGRLTAIKSFCKNVSNNGAGAGLARKHQVLVRSNIYNALTPALVAMHEQLCALEHRSRRLTLTNFLLFVAILAVIGTAVILH